MKQVSLLILACVMVSQAYCQKYTVERSTVGFYSHATIEDIKADNKKSSGIYNTANGDIVFSIPINEFQFEKSLMQEHFNEKYMESDKFPKATFQGKVSGADASAKASGKLAIHGVTNEVEIPGTIEKKDDKLVLKTKFTVKLADYSITIPQLLWKNIAEQVEVTCEFVFKPQ